MVGFEGTLHPTHPHCGQDCHLPHQAAQDPIQPGPGHLQGHPQLQKDGKEQAGGASIRSWGHPDSSSTAGTFSGQEAFFAGKNSHEDIPRSSHWVQVQKCGSQAPGIMTTGPSVPNRARNSTRGCKKKQGEKGSNVLLTGQSPSMRLHPAAASGSAFGRGKASRWEVRAAAQRLLGVQPGMAGAEQQMGSLGAQPMHLHCADFWSPGLLFPIACLV